MTSLAEIRLVLVVGTTAHTQTVIEDFWAQANSALTKNGIELRGVALYLSAESARPVSPSSNLKLIDIDQTSPLLMQKIAENIEHKLGPMGVLGRLLSANGASRRFAMAVRKNEQASAFLQHADIVISTDSVSDRAVWNVRRSSSADLMHGAIAMRAAIDRRVKAMPSAISQQGQLHEK